ncbi:MAG: single-stranded DNA-binding protein [Spirochaetaceae bacterium]|nr:MAG: single-stranded DNA-binding protein [Spirochaetaceae bacterium]
MALIAATDWLAAAADRLHFAEPVAQCYNPLIYAADVHHEYIRRYATTKKKVVFFGMNPGPFGMAQTGVPFGEIAAVRDWMQLTGAITPPAQQHPKRPITGFDCAKSEVSGRRFWGLMRDRFGTAQAFFASHFVVNYCPLVFMEDSGRNRTPNQLPKSERQELFALCDEHLRTVAEVLQPEWVIGIGNFAAERIRHALASAEGPGAALGGGSCRIASIIHPSPANPKANADWVGAVTKSLIELGVWPA